MAKGKIISILISLIIGAILGGMLTFYFVLFDMKDAINFMSGMQSEKAFSESASFHHNRAYKAYREEDPIIGIWALTGVVEEQKLLLKKSNKNSVFYTQNALLGDLMLSHGRMAKLYILQNQNNKAKEHQKKALFYAKKAFPKEQIVNITKVMEIIDKIDNTANN